MIALSSAGLVMLLGSNGLQPVPLATAGWLTLAGIFGFVAYLAVVLAMREGDIALISPFRYTRLLFAMAAGILIFGEQPNALTWAGATLVLGTGLYSAWREHLRSRTG